MTIEEVEKLLREAAEEIKLKPFDFESVLKKIKEFEENNKDTKTDE